MYHTQRADDSTLLTGKALLSSQSQWLAEDKEKQDWVQRLPKIIEWAKQHWHLQTLSPCLPGAGMSFTCKATQNDKAVVLKLQVPQYDSTLEAQALLFWKGKGAIDVLDYNIENAALLLPLCQPGTTLTQTLQDTPHFEPFPTLTNLLTNLRTPIYNTSVSFISLYSETLKWEKTLLQALKGNSKHHPLYKAALNSIQFLKTTPAPSPILLNQDLHGGNILNHGKKWLMIDPKPVYGDPNFMLAPIARCQEYGPGKSQTIHRMEVLSQALDLDKTRVKAWALAQASAWSLWSHARKESYRQTAQWMMEWQ